MAKQLSREDWMKLFALYEKVNHKLFWIKYEALRGCKVTKNAKVWFRFKYNLFVNGNQNIIISMTGKKATGRPKKKKKITWDDFTREELIEIAKRYKEIQKEKSKKDKMNEARKLNISIIKLVWVLYISKSGYYRNKKVRYKTRRCPALEKIIIDSFYENKMIYGRRRLKHFILMTYGIDLNSRTIGNYLSALGLKTLTRKAKRTREIKNTNVIYRDLVKRNFNQENVIATYISYIPVKNNQTNFAYLSIAINHKTKYIESWNLSLVNNNNLVIKHFKNLDLNNKTIHSDHGHQYSSKAFAKLIENGNGKISMSRIGNSLDNREAEYFFSNIKGEYLNHINTQKMDIETLRIKIADYIYWYNYKRIQSKLKWKAPAFARA